jgi:phosphohistidine phosphatase
VVVVGHQPDLGRTAAFLVSGSAEEWRIKKGSLWWISKKNGDELIVRAVASPDLL